MSTYPKTPDLNRRFMTVYMADVSTMGQIYVVPGFRGKIKAIHTVMNGTITGTDAIITPKIEGTAVTNGAVTLAVSGAAAGVKDSSVPTAANTFTATDAIELETDGGSTGTVEVMITLELEAT